MSTTSASEVNLKQFEMYAGCRCKPATGAKCSRKKQNSVRTKANNAAVTFLVRQRLQQFQDFQIILYQSTFKFVLRLPATARSVMITFASVRSLMLLLRRESIKLTAFEECTLHVDVLHFVTKPGSFFSLCANNRNDTGFDPDNGTFQYCHRTQASNLTK